MFLCFIYSQLFPETHRSLGLVAAGPSISSDIPPAIETEQVSSILCSTISQSWLCSSTISQSWLCSSTISHSSANHHRQLAESASFAPNISDMWNLILSLLPQFSKILLGILVVCKIFKTAERITLLSAKFIPLGLQLGVKKRLSPKLLNLHKTAKAESVLSFLGMFSKHWY